MKKIILTATVLVGLALIGVSAASAGDPSCVCDKKHCYCDTPA